MYKVLVKSLSSDYSYSWEFETESARDQFVTDVIQTHGADTYDYYYSEKK